MNHEIVMLPPEHCRGCKWKPPEWRDKGKPVAVEDAWLILPIQNSVVWLYVCPKCGFVMPNDNAIDNVKELIEARKSKIVTPGQPKFVVPDDVTKSKLN